MSDVTRPGPPRDDAVVVLGAGHAGDLLRDLRRQLASLLDEFHMHRLGGEIDDEIGDAQYVEAEVSFFDDVVKGVLARRSEIDELLTSKLDEGWKIERLDKTMLQILRAGAYELLARPDVATGSVITEYLDVAHAFFEKREAKFVNGLLDAVAKAVR